MVKTSGRKVTKSTKKVNKVTKKDILNSSKLIMIGTCIFILLVICFLLYEYLAF